MSSKAILILAFFEGVSVMLIELLGGKMLIPFFGNSLVIWTSTIGVTMSSLMIGYFLGGYLSKWNKSLVVLFAMLSTAILWIILMPYIADKSINLFRHAELHSGSVLSATALLALPLVLFGACPPILIAQLTNKNNVGLSSGKVFAFSTIGSVVCALFVGFFIIESYGIRLPLVIYAFIFFILICILLWSVLKEKIFFFIVALPIFLIGIATTRSLNDVSPLYLSESLQGQLKVADLTKNPGLPRVLKINGVNQTQAYINFNTPSLSRSAWWYVHLDASFASHKPAGSKALLLGFGGGSIALELRNLGFELDVVEIDGRLPSIAHDYFLLDTVGINFNIDDARHYIKKQQNIIHKYDIVVIDLLHGEVQPNHVFTVEGLGELKNLLKEDATVLVNYQTNYDEPLTPYLSILKTFWEANYDAKVTTLKKMRPSDIVFIASPTQLPKNLIDNNHLNDCCFYHKEVRSFIDNPTYITNKNVDQTLIDKIPVLYDEKPVLELMNKETSANWRQNMNKIQKDFGLQNPK